MRMARGRSSGACFIQRAIFWLMMVCGITVSLARDVDFAGGAMGGDDDEGTGNDLTNVTAATRTNATGCQQESDNSVDGLGPDWTTRRRRYGDDDRDGTKDEEGHSSDELWAHGLWWSAAALATAVAAVDEGRCSPSGVVRAPKAAAKVAGARTSRTKSAGVEARKSRAPWTAPTRWALAGARIGGSRRRRRCRRGAVVALLLGPRCSCGIRWKPWTSDCEAEKFEAEAARHGTLHIAREEVGPVHPRRAAGEPHGPDEEAAYASRGGRRVSTLDRKREDVVTSALRRPASLTTRRGPRPTFALLAAVTLAAHGLGQAANPGPACGAVGTVELKTNKADWRGFVEYPVPHRDGFRDIATPGFGGGTGAGRRPPEEEFHLQIESVNTTGWGPLRRRLAETTAHVIIAQETWLLIDQAASASDWARRHGWEAVMAPAALGPGGGASGGVAIFARSGMGLHHPCVGPHILEDARAVAAVVEPPGHRPILLASLYLRDGKGTCAENKATMARVGECVEAQGPGCLLICGGDFQCSPAAIEDSGFPRQVRGRVLAASSARGTFRSAAAASTIDFYVASEDLAHAVETVSLVEGTGIKGHVPVRLAFAPRPVALKALSFRRPPELGLDRVHGPLPAPPCWKEARDAANEAQCAAARGLGDQEVQRRIDRAYETWCQVAELEVANATGADPRKWGLRGRRPRLQWTSVLPEKSNEGRSIRGGGNHVDPRIRHRAQQDRWGAER